MTLVKLLEGNAKKMPEKAAVIFRDEVINYQQLNARANRLANALLLMGLKKGDCVGLMMPRVPELVIGFLGVCKSGGIAVPLNFELSSEDNRTVIERVSPHCLIVDSSFVELAKKSLPDGADVRIIVVGDKVDGCLLWDDVLSAGKQDNPGVDISDDDVAYLNYTSGSTGESKGAMATHSNIYRNTLAAIETLGLVADDVHLCMFAPFAHPHEIIARPLLLGGTMVLLDKIYPKTLAEAITRHKVTCMMGLAPLYDNLLSVAEHGPYDLSSLRIPESGGMYTHPSLIERFRQQVGVPIIAVWGSTETTGVALANRPGEDIYDGSVGRPCNFYDVRLVDDNGREVETGDVGEMIFRGPGVVRGYYENSQVDGECFRNGWYFSGDLARKDKHGNFYFVARKTEMMKVAGLKVYPLEIEQVCAEHPGIKEAVVVAAKDTLRGEVPRAVIVAKDGVELNKKEIMSFWRKRLAHYKVPRIVEIRDSLPKNGSGGKIDKKVLRLELL